MAQTMTDEKAPSRQAGAIAPILLGRSLILAVLVLVLVGLQYQLWYGKYGRKNMAALQESYDVQAQKNLLQQQKLDRLSADVSVLEGDAAAIEEHARLDLGLIKSGEMFVQLSNAQATKLSDEQSGEKEPDAVEILDVID